MMNARVAVAVAAAAGGGFAESSNIDGTRLQAHLRLRLSFNGQEVKKQVQILLRADDFRSLRT